MAIQPFKKLTAIYHQSAVIPYRKKGKRVQIMMITSRKRKRWVLPKGIVEPYLSAAESAAKEAYEEAGIQGIVSEHVIGRYHYAKWNGLCHVEVYPMRVEKLLNHWPEEYRKREWVTVETAVKRVNEPDLKEILYRFHHLLVQGEAWSPPSV